MTNKRIFQLSTLVIIVLITILAISCKKKPTQAGLSLSESEETTQTEVANTIKQFEGKVYKSGNHIYKLNRNHIFYFTAEVKNGKIVVNRYDAKTGERNLNTDYPHTYPVINGEANGPYTFVKNDYSVGNGNTLEINEGIYYITGGKATFEASGNLTIVFQSGGETQTVKFIAQ